jgi:UDP-2,4-diacetamido-2,4,6-trideoxy-beta-L-altropyranose hydrolase
MSEGLSLRKARPLRIRPASIGDCRCLWEWANDPDVRASAFNSDKIVWDEHILWFQEKLQDSNCRIFVAYNDFDEPIGQIRFERIGRSEADIDITIGNRSRGCGYARQLIELGAQQIFNDWHVEHLHAFVKPENTISRRVFERSGFTRLEGARVKGQAAIHYVRKAE